MTNLLTPSISALADLTEKKAEYLLSVQEKIDRTPPGPERDRLSRTAAALEKEIITLDKIAGEIEAAAQVIDQEINTLKYQAQIAQRNHRELSELYINAARGERHGLRILTALIEKLK